MKVCNKIVMKYLTISKYVRAIRLFLACKFIFLKLMLKHKLLGYDNNFSNHFSVPKIPQKKQFISYN